MVWRVPADFAHFKSHTMGCPVIMGRSSWEALDGALPGRDNIVLTRSRTYHAEGAKVVHSLGQALEVASWAAQRDQAQVIWVAGGAQVYAEAMDIVDELVISDLDLDVAAQGHTGPLVHAPAIDPGIWAADPERSDATWRDQSGDARWRVTTYVRR